MENMPMSTTLFYSEIMQKHSPIYLSLWSMAISKIPSGPQLRYQLLDKSFLYLTQCLSYVDLLLWLKIIEFKAAQSSATRVLIARKEHFSKSLSITKDNLRWDSIRWTLLALSSVDSKMVPFMRLSSQISWSYTIINLRLLSRPTSLENSWELSLTWYLTTSQASFKVLRSKSLRILTITVLLKFSTDIL